MQQRLYQVATFVQDEEHPTAQRVEFVAQHHCPIVLSRYLSWHRCPGDRVLWSRIK